jgi:prophage antirepressor-like protein
METFTFNATDTAIRVKTVEGEPWFVAKDLCKALNITWSGHTLDQIPDEWKGMVNFTTPGGNQELTCITEAGMYKLAFRCQSSEVADKFTNWVASEVLPTIRKTGRYEMRKPKEGCAQKRRARRGELINAEVLNLLWLIGESLERGDQKQVALELGVTVSAVNNTLNGYQRSPRILKALYRKALERREEFMLYNCPAVMADRLVSGERTRINNPLPPVHIEGKRGLLGNQNARKVKEGGER